MKVLRTPDERFEGLVDWPFAPHYREVTDADGTVLRLAYVDEGPREAPPVLLMHGEPSWSYLYRKIIPGLVARGHRVVAPDLIGFGRSDKPAARTDYTYARHLDWTGQWLTGLDLTDIVMFCQDWGGLIGLRMATTYPERFSGIAVANTGMPTGAGMTDGFAAWLNMSQNIPIFATGALLNMGSGRELSAEEMAAYDAPFPDESYKEGARQFPTLVPVTPQHDQAAENIEAWKVLGAFEKPVVTCFSDGDPVSQGGDKVFQERVPGAKGQPHTILKGGHFLQEDSPAEIVEIIDALAKRARG
jgi:haloalkane dehalogenase